jgi:hypothetical protein
VVADPALLQAGDGDQLLHRQFGAAEQCAKPQPDGVRKQLQGGVEAGEGYGQRRRRLYHDIMMFRNNRSEGCDGPPVRSSKLRFLGPASSLLAP